MSMTSVIPFGVINHVRNMIVNNEAIKTDFFERAHRFHRIKIAFAQETFLKRGDTPLHIPHMHIENLVAFTEVTDGVNDVIAHFTVAAHTKFDAMIRTW